MSTITIDLTPVDGSNGVHMIRQSYLAAKIAQQLKIDIAEVEREIAESSLLVPKIRNDKLFWELYDTGLSYPTCIALVR